MIDIKVIIILLITHYISDFICQTERMAVLKSKESLILFSHIVAYTLSSIVLYCLLLSNVYKCSDLIMFAILNGTVHYMVDYISSPLISKRFKWMEERKHLPLGKTFNFGAFAYIGLDQLMHQISIIGMFYIIFIH